ncbi:hypothetical protein M378DRAFT_154628 [Amanita muscaria Koide BX008]|uniref:Uncharacterized protein n=1 Tax=Amanita muscaria (strain Koide BX008) TaxID=946122 RepID=A0A0C2XPN4_AMAMK|nr:hypothetical protein M378DRAFT_154628 [Amanita muscaria Koide BX008]
MDLSPSPTPLSFLASPYLLLLELQIKNVTVHEQTMTSVTLHTKVSSEKFHTHHDCSIYRTNLFKLKGAFTLVLKGGRSGCTAFEYIEFCRCPARV